MRITPILVAILTTALSLASVQAEDADTPAATCPAPAAHVQDPSSDESNIDDLSRQTSDPTASLLALNFQDIYSTFHGPAVPGEPNDRWTLQVRPVIPFEPLAKPNILRLTIPYQTGGRGDEGWQPIAVFDLVVFNESWGRWGVGPVMSHDTTGDAPDGFVLGPAVGGVWPVGRKLNLGLFSQNVFSTDTGISSLQPVIAYQLGHGASVSAGDAQFTHDW